jgi:diguanylate cyclase (GGDEF)-like protein
MGRNQYLSRQWKKAAKVCNLPAAKLKQVVETLYDMNLIDLLDSTEVNINGPFLASKVSQEKLMRLACYDPLTNLANEFMFRDRVNYLIQTNKRNGRSFALMFIDLNKFKEVNDTYGHAAGDYVLQEVATILAGSVRSSDLVSRLHGDEFVILFDGVHGHTDEVVAVCHKIRERITTIRYQDRDLDLSASYGFSFYPQDGKNADDLLCAADTAMYKDKFIQK